MGMCIFMRKLFHRFLFCMAHFILIGFTGSFQNMFDLRYRDDREKFREQEITGKEQPEGSRIEPDLPDRRTIIDRPAAWQVISVDGGYDDHKAFEPHPDVHDNGHEEGYHKIPSHFPEPEDLREQYVTAHHDIIAPSERAERVHTVLHEGPVLEFIHAIPGDE